MTQFVLLGLGAGGLYALGALGIITIYRGSRTLNFAHGAVATWGAFIFIELRDGRGWPGATALGAVAVLAGAFGALAYLVAIRPLRSATELTRALATVGMLVVLQTGALRIWGAEGVLVKSSLPNESIDVLGARVGADRVILLVIAVVATFVLSLAASRSRFQLLTRATAENERAASALGASPVVLGAANWALGCVLAAVAGSLLVPVLGLGVATVGMLLVPSLAAALVGRFDSYTFATVGALALGVAESLATRFIAVPGWGSAAPVLLVVVVLMARRGEAPNRLRGQLASRVGDGAGRPAVLVVAAVLVAGCAVAAPFSWVDAATTSLVWSLLALSLVVLIGFANQISLAQLAIAGLSGFVAVKAAIHFDLPFVVAPLFGAVVGAVVGLVFGLPAVRVRGINLAVVTLAMGLAAERIVFNNSAYTGGFSGLTLPEPTILGVSFDATSEPRKYAVFALVWTVVAFGCVIALRRSHYGRRLLAVRTNERAASSLGVAVAQAKLTAFVASAALAGLAGTLMCYRQRSVTFDGFELMRSIQLVPIAVIGGIGSPAGAAAAGVIASGGVLMELVDRIGWSTYNVDLVLGAGLILALRLHPDGIAGIGRRIRQTTLFGAADGREPGTLSVDSVSVRFGGVHAVRDVSFTVRPGEVVGLVGPNGAGKTSLLDAISGFAPVADGSIMLDDSDLPTCRPHDRARAGVARSFQGLDLFDDLTVAENLALAAEGAGIRRGELPAAAVRTIDSLRLSDWFGNRPSDLPQGVRRQVALVRALASDAAVVLLDEPGAGISGRESDALAAEIRAVATVAGMGVLLVDHDMNLIGQTCDRVIVMDQGTAIAEGTLDDVVQNQKVRDAYLGSSEEPGAVKPETSPFVEEVVP